MLIIHHPKYIKRLAGIYVDKYLKEGQEKALEWADTLLSVDDMKAVAPEAKKEFNRRGVKT